MSISDKIFAYIYNKDDLTPETIEQYKNSLIFIGKDRQIYQPLTNTYIGISQTELEINLSLNNKVISTNENFGYYVTFSNVINGYSYAFTDENLIYNPYTNTLTALKFKGNLEGNAYTASKLNDDNTYTAWGQTFFENGLPQNINDQPISYTRNITPNTTYSYTLGAPNKFFAYSYSRAFIGTLHGNVQGNAKSANSAITSNISNIGYKEKIIETQNDSAYFVTFSNVISGYSYSYTDQNLHYNPYTNTLNALNFVGVLEPSLQWGEIIGEDDPELIAKFVVNSTSTAIDIMNIIAQTNNYFTKVEIDGVKMGTITSTHTFTTVGTHTIKYTLSTSSLISISMFNGCSNLTEITIPNIVTSINNNAFYDCINLSVINLPNSIVSIGNSSFENCTSLTNINIPDSVTTIGNNTFKSCTNVTTLTFGNNITTIGNEAFSGCSSLDTIICEKENAPTIQIDTFKDVKVGGTLYSCDNDDTYNSWLNNSAYYLGYYNWNSHYIHKYFTMVSLEDNNVISIKNVNCSILPTFEYSLNNGSSWASIRAVKNTTQTIATINTGECIMFRSVNDTLSTAYNQYNMFTGSKTYKVNGNILSLLYGADFDGYTELPSGSIKHFCGLFYDSSTLVDAQNLIITPSILYNSTFNGTFRNCTSLRYAPKLPAMTLANECYSSMFEGDISLITAPELPATTLANLCYSRMFCMSRTTTVTAAMTESPILRALTIPSKAYQDMFRGNGSITKITCLATTLSTSDACLNWVNGVGSTGTFIKNSSMTGWSTGVNGIPSGWTVS